MAHTGQPHSHQRKEEISLSNIGTNLYDSSSNNDEHTYDDINVAARCAKSTDMKQSDVNGRHEVFTSDTTLKPEGTVSRRMILLAIIGSLLLSTLISVIVGITVYHMTIAKMVDSDQLDTDRATITASKYQTDELASTVKQLEENLTASSDEWSIQILSLNNKLTKRLTTASGVWNEEMMSLKSNLSELTSTLSDVVDGEMVSLKAELSEMKNNLSDVSNVAITSLKSDVLELKNNLKKSSDAWNEEAASIKRNLSALQYSNRDCSELYAAGTVEDGVHTISPDGHCPFQVYCDMTGGGWTLIQKRQDGSINFHRSWNDYEEGFGNIDGEHWLGLDKIHRLTADGSEIYFNFEYYDGTTGFAHYQAFSVQGAVSAYRMNVDAFGYEGTINELFSYHNNMKFTTFDRDNDQHGAGNNCASEYGGGAWWYNACYKLGNLNGVYGKRGEGGIGYSSSRLIYLKSVNISVKRNNC